MSIGTLYAQEMPGVIRVTGRPAEAGHLKRVVSLFLERAGFSPDALQGVPFKSIQEGESLSLEIPLMPLPSPSGGEPEQGAAPAVKKQKITLVNAGLPAVPTKLLAFSNHPEKIKKPGLLFEAGLLKFKPVRLRYYHHVDNGDPARYVGFYILNPTKAPASVHIIESVGGPSRDMMLAGHMNNMKFFHSLETGQGWVEEIPPGTARLMRKVLLGPGEVISANNDLNLIEGGPVHMLVYASDQGEEPVLYPLQTDKEDRHVRGAYPLTTIRTDVGFSLDQGESFFNVSDTPIGDIFKFRSTKGGYGIMYEYDITLKNPGATEGAAALIFQPRGGVATATFCLDGELISVGTTKAYQMVRLARIVLPPGGTKKLRLRTMPEDASNYPVRLILMTDRQEE
jgi:hypothetical protein